MLSIVIPKTTVVVRPFFMRSWIRYLFAQPLGLSV